MARQGVALTFAIQSRTAPPDLAGVAYSRDRRKETTLHDIWPNAGGNCLADQPNMERESPAASAAEVAAEVAARAASSGSEGGRAYSHQNSTAQHAEEGLTCRRPCAGACPSRALCLRPYERRYPFRQPRASNQRELQAQTNERVYTWSACTL